MATDKNFVVKNGLEVGGVLIVNSSGQLEVTTVVSDLHFQDNIKARFGLGNDLQIYHDGTDSNIINFTGDLVLRNGATDKDIIFQSDDGSGSETQYFRLDGSLTKTYFEQNVQFNDNVRAQFGADADLQIYHSSGNNFINAPVGGNLILQANNVTARSVAQENMISAVANGAVSLYYDNAAKLATTSTGIDVTGNIVADGGTIDGTFIVDGGTGVDSTGVFHVRQDGDSANNGIAITSSNATSHRIWKDGSGNLNIGSSTVTNAFKQDLSGNITIAGEIYAKDSDSSADPTITFTGHTDTGLAVREISGNDELYFTTDGTARAYVNVSGIFSQGNVYTATSGDFRNYGGTWHGTTGVSGNGFVFTNTADSVTPFSLTSSGQLTLTNQSTTTYMTHLSNGQLRNESSNGYIEIGPANTSHAHIETDRSNFYFNKELRVDTGVIGSYNEDLYLRRASSASGQLQLTEHKLAASATSKSDQLVLGGFVAEASLENSRHFYHPGLQTNVLAGLHLRGTVTGTKNGSAQSIGSQPFLAGSEHSSITVANSDVVVITLTGFTGLSYSSSAGIVFGNDSFRAQDIEIETSTDGGTTWTSRLDVTNQAATTVVADFSSGGTASNAIRYTLTNFSSTSLRILSLFAYRYNSNDQYFAQLYKDETIYSNWTFRDNKYLKLGNGGDLQIYHDGTDSLVRNFTNDLIIQNDVDDKDIIIRTDDGSGGVTPYMTFDGSDTLTRAYKTILFQDSVKASFGNSEDMRIKHDGTNGSIDNYTGALLLRNNVDDNDIILQSDDGSGGLADYIRLDGSDTSVRVSQHLKLPDNKAIYFGDGEDLNIWHSGTNSLIDHIGTGNLYLRNTTNDKSIYLQTDDGSGGLAAYVIANGSSGTVTLSYYGSQKLITKSDGVDVTGELQADSLDIDGAGDISGNLTVHGNLTVNGSTVTNSATNTTIEDALIELGSGNTGTNSNDLGLILERGTSGNNAFIGFDESDDQIVFALTTATGSSTGNLAFSSFLPIRAAGITGTSLDINGNADISGNLVIQGADVDIASIIRHIGDTNTFFGFHGNDLWRVATGGVERFEVGNTGIRVNDTGVDMDFTIESNNDANMFFVDGGNDKIGIGTSSPEEKIEVNGNVRMQSPISTTTARPAATVATLSSGEIRAKNGDSSDGGLLRLSAGAGTTQSTMSYIDLQGYSTAETGNGKHIFFGTGGADRMVINGSGNVGIGTSSPNNKLQVVGAADGINIVGTNSYLRWNSGDMMIRNEGSYAMGFHTYNGSSAMVEHMRITSAGNVGIGISSPGQLLDVGGIIRSSATNPQVRIHTSSGTGTGYLVFGDSVDDDIGQVYYSHANNEMAFVVNAGTKMMVKSTGYVGIGTTSPADKLEVHGNSRADRFIADGSGAMLRKQVDSWSAGAQTHDILYNGWTSSTGDYTYLKAAGNGLSGHGIVQVGDLGTWIGQTDLEQGALADSNTSPITTVFAFFRNDISYIKGNVGIGTASPDVKLHLEDASRVDIKFEKTGSETHYIRKDGDYLRFRGHDDSTVLFELQNNTNGSNVSAFPNGNVGIGTTSPGFKLDVNGETRIQNQLRLQASTPSIRFIDSDDNSDGYIQANGGTLRFYADDNNEVSSSLMTWNIDGSEKMRLRSSGFLGIGATTPVDLLHIKSSTTDARAVIDGHTAFDAELKFAENGTVAYTIGHNAADDTFRIGTVNVDTNPRFVIDSAGNIGIGTTSPDHLLELSAPMGSSPTNVIFLRQTGTNATGGGGAIRFDTSATTDDHTIYYASVEGLRSDAGNGSSELHFKTTMHTISTTPATRMFIQDDGNVGIGTTSPDKALTISASDSQVRLYDADGTNQFASFQSDNGIAKITSRNNTSHGQIAFQRYNGTVVTESMRINSSGNVGIGTSSPAFTLDVSGNIRATGYVRVNSGGSYRLYNSSGNAWVELFFDQTNNMLQVQRGFKPSGDSQLDLGTTAVRWRNVYADTYYGSGANLTDITASNADTVDNLHAASFIRSDANDDFSGTLNYTPDTGDVINFDGQSVIRRMTANGGLAIGHDDALILTAGEAGSPLRNSSNVAPATETIFMGAEGGVIMYAFPNNDVTWSNRKSLSFDGANGLNMNSVFTVDISGNLSATTKSFDIEHPTKEGMRLHHGVLEGPEHAVYIRGKSNSYIIELPDYWEGLVHEDTITVQLTPIGGQNDMWIENIEDNKVYINCEREMKQYFYFIQAERKDIERFEVEYES